MTETLTVTAKEWQENMTNPVFVAPAGFATDGISVEITVSRATFIEDLETASGWMVDKAIHARNLHKEGKTRKLP